MESIDLLSLTVTDNPSLLDLALISDNVIQSGRSSNPNGGAMPLACLIREQDLLVAGGIGRTEFGRLFINYLWVAEPLRCKGLATKILATMEREARLRGCHDALIETLIDSVAAFYQRLGYECIAVLPDFCGPVTRHTLRKNLS